MSAIRYCGRCLSTFETDPPTCPNLACSSNRPGPGWGLVLAEGDVLDRTYRVERCLAVGGAGLTYLGREIGADGELSGPRVAIKVLYTARAAGPFLRRLSTEAQILQELAHENIVELRGFVHRAGQEPYLVTRFEEGGSLGQYIERVGNVSPRVAVGILRQVLLGLDVAHQRGVVHRDLKPDNVLLHAVTDRDVIPHVRVADFGIAKIAGGQVGERLTRMGAFVGTPEYAAPEQFEGKVPTPATDVFAAGGLLVFLLTGQPPFQFSHRSDIATSYEELLAQLPPRLAALQYVEGDEATRALLREVLLEMLVLEQENRATIHRVLSRLTPLVDPSPARSNTIDMSTSAVPTPPVLRRPKLASSDAAPVPPPTGHGGVEDTGEVTHPVALASHPGLRTAPTMAPDDVTAESEEDGSEEPTAAELADTEVAGPPPVHAEADTEVAGSSHAPPVLVLDDAPPPPPPTSQGIAVPPPPPPPPRAMPPMPESASDTAVSASVPLPKIPPEPPPPPTPTKTPPPFVPVGPDEPMEPPVIARTTPPPASSGRGATAGLAGCFGLSMFGVVSASVLGLLGVAVVLVGVAVGAGWFELPGGTTPIVVGDDVPERFKRASPLPDADQRKVIRAVRDLKSTISGHCGTGAAVSADILVEKGGDVVYAKVSPNGLGGVDAACVKRGLEHVNVRGGVSAEGIAHVDLGL